MTNFKLAVCLLKLANLYASNSDVKQPADFAEIACGARRGVTIFCHDSAEAAATLGAFGPGSKCDDIDAIRFYPYNYPLVNICIFKSGVCERVKVGEREIPEIVIPTRAQVVIPAHTEEVGEWRCGSLLDQVPGSGEGGLRP